jgi:hypothetical protein
MLTGLAFITIGFLLIKFAMAEKRNENSEWIDSVATISDVVITDMFKIGEDKYSLNYSYTISFLTSSDEPSSFTCTDFKVGDTVDGEIPTDDIFEMAGVRNICYKRYNPHEFKFGTSDKSDKMDRFIFTLITAGIIFYGAINAFAAIYIYKKIDKVKL